MKLLIPIIFLISSISYAKNIQVHGHRGARMVRPENTMAAFKYALKYVDVLELDLSVTKDNVLIVSHDPYVDPVICQYKNGKKLKQKIIIKTLTLKQIKKFDCGSLINPRFKKQVLSPGEEIPTLDEVFSYVKSKSKTVEFNIETKIVPGMKDLTVSPKIFAELLVLKIKEYSLTKRVIVQSFDYRTLKWVKKMNPKIRTSQLTYESMVDMVGAVKSIKADYVSPYHKWISKEEVKRLQKNGIKVAPWTANDKATWKRLVDIGVDAIITDDPKGLKEFLDKK